MQFFYQGEMPNFVFHHLVTVSVFKLSKIYRKFFM